MPAGPDGDEVAVVIPAWRAMATLPAVLDRLAEDRHLVAEVLVVESSGDGSGTEIRRRWPWVTVVEIGQRTLPGRARNAGAEVTSASILVFLDADAVPGDGWLQAMLRPIREQGADVVAGAVANGTPRHPVGTAGWLLEFSDVMPGPPRSLLHGTSCSMAVTRTAFVRAGRFPEDLFPGEDTVLTMRISGFGRLVFAPDAVVVHRNRTGVVEYLAHQYRLGVSFAAVCRAVPFPHRRLARPSLVPLGSALRAVALGLRLRRHPRDAGKAVLLSPLIAVGLVAWSMGVIFAARQ